jgi:molecular chaperone DnaK
MGAAIGIDLGTTNSVVAIYREGRVQVMEHASGTRTMPSMVTFAEDFTPLVGHAAKAHQITSPERTIYSIKRFMGRRHAEVRTEEKLVPYEVVGRPDELVRVRMGRRLFTPQEISAMILEELRFLAEGSLGEAVSEAVITVPAYFNDAQRQATKEAAEIAGLRARRIINEPTAAALAYGLEQQERRRRAIVVDFGGGTLDLSAMDIGDGAFEVLAVHGNTHLGGDDFDQRIIDVVADDFFRRERIDLREDAMALQRLKDAAQRAKMELSSAEQAEVMLPYVAVNARGPVHLQYTLTRATFESVCSDLLASFRECCDELRRTNGLGGFKNADVILVGGSTRMPAVRRIVSDVFGTERLNRSVNPDEVVAVGAASLAAVLSGSLRNVALMDVTSQTLGVESLGGGVSVLVPKNTPIPCKVSRVYSTPRDHQTSVPINVIEGDAVRASDNRTLGEFQLRGIARAKRGVPKIEVAFEIDADGILSVAGTDTSTGRRQEIIVRGGSGLESGDRQRMVDEGEQRRASNRSRGTTVELRSHAEGVAINLRKWLEHNREYLKPRARQEIEAGLKSLSLAIESDKIEKMRAALKRLDTVMPQGAKAG